MAFSVGVAIRQRDPTLMRPPLGYTPRPLADLHRHRFFGIGGGASWSRYPRRCFKTINASTFLGRMWFSSAHRIAY